MIEKDSKLNVLLVESAVSRISLIRDALTRSQNPCRLHAVGVDKNTLSYLRKDGPFATAPTPDLVMFDVSEPERNDLKILDRMQKETAARDVPMVVLTSAETEAIIEDNYSEQNGCVLFSPIELDNFLSTMHARSPARFLSAVTLIQKIGFVMVRLPQDATNCGAVGPAAAAN